MSKKIYREAYYTLPTEKCPHPEWWTTEGGEETEVEVSMFIAAMIRATQPQFVLEVGTHVGQTTERIGMILAQNNHGECVSLELNEDNAKLARERCKNYKQVKIVTVNSLEYVPEKPIDFLFVDGSPDRDKDVFHFAEYLAPGAVVIVHDTANMPYINQVPGILEKLSGTHIQLNTPRGLLVVKT